jgi:flagellar biosynthesis protein FlhG
VLSAGAPEKRPRVWAVGGGKGGVGKSVITSSLAIAAARRGRRCVLLDADLGGANLHTLLGLSNPRATLSDIFRRQASGLRDILIPTSIPNLQMISGAGAMLDAANPHHAQKIKVIRQLFTLEADDIFLDLGAGTSFTVLDFFLAAREAIVVVTPTPTSVENAYFFLKAVFFRCLKQVLTAAGCMDIAGKALEEKLARGIRTPSDLLAEIRRISPAVGEAATAEIGSLKLRVLINQVHQEEDLQLGLQISEACRDFFNLQVDRLGEIRHDDKVMAAEQMRRPVMLAFPQCSFAETIDGMVGRLIEPQGMLP